MKKQEIVWKFTPYLFTRVFPSLAQLVEGGPFIGGWLVGWLVILFTAFYVFQPEIVWQSQLLFYSSSGAWRGCVCV